MSDSLDKPVETNCRNIVIEKHFIFYPSIVNATPEIVAGKKLLADK
jgi:hypothetical protein